MIKATTTIINLIFIVKSELLFNSHFTIYGLIIDLHNKTHLHHVAAFKGNVKNSLKNIICVMCQPILDMSCVIHHICALVFHSTYHMLLNLNHTLVVDAVLI